MADGLYLKLSTKEAVAEQERLDSALAKTTTSIQAQDKTSTALEGSFTRSATKQAAASTAMAAANRAGAASFGQLGKTGETAVSVMSKLLAATGSGGAAKAVGLLGTGLKGLIGSISPLGLAIGVVGTAVFTFASNALAAEDATAKMRQEVADSNSTFNSFATSLGRVDEIIGKLASGSGRGATFTTFAKESERLKTLLEEQTKAAVDLGYELERTGSVTLYAKQIEKLGEAVQKPVRFFKDLDLAIAANGVSYGSLDARTRGALRRLQEEVGIRRENNQIVLDGAAAQKELAEALRQTNFALGENEPRVQKEQSEDLTNRLRALFLARREEQELAAAGNNERQAEIALRKELGDSIGALNDKQRELIALILNNAIALDQKEAAQKRADEEAKKALDLDRRRADVLRDITDQTFLAGAVTDDEVTARQRLLRLNQALIQSETDLTQESGKAIQAALQRAAQVEDATKRAKEIGDLAGNSIGTIATGFLNGALAGQGFRQTLRGISEDLARIAVNRLVIDKLVQLGGAAIGRLFANPEANRPAGQQGPLQANGQFARGGIVDDPSAPRVFAARGLVLDRSQTFAAGRTRISVAEGGASTPEAIVPLQRDQYGRLGIGAAGGAATYVVNMPNVKSAEEARRIRPTMRQVMESIERGNKRTRSGLRAGM